MNHQQVPTELARLWRVSAESKRGRPAQIDIDKVVRASVTLADRSGLAGVTLPKVAEILGVTKMSLYRHVGSKDELLELMADHAQGVAPGIVPDPGWRQGLREWACAIAEVIQRHDWLCDLPQAGPPAGPNSTSWLDMGLRQLRDTALDPSAKVAIIQLLSVHVRSWVMLRRAFDSREQGSGLGQAEIERDYGRNLALLVDPQRFPDAAALFTSSVFEPSQKGHDGELDDDLHFGIELILDGVAVAAEARTDVE